MTIAPERPGTMPTFTPDWANPDRNHEGPLTTEDTPAPPVHDTMSDIYRAGGFFLDIIIPTNFGPEDDEDDGPIAASAANSIPDELQDRVQTLLLAIVLQDLADSVVRYSITSGGNYCPILGIPCSGLCHSA
jgi:hypothetical protein